MSETPWVVPVWKTINAGDTVWVGGRNVTPRLAPEEPPRREVDTVEVWVCGELVEWSPARDRAGSVVNDR